MKEEETGKRAKEEWREEGVSGALDGESWRSVVSHGDNDFSTGGMGKDAQATGGRVHGQGCPCHGEKRGDGHEGVLSVGRSFGSARPWRGERLAEHAGCRGARPTGQQDL
jgi:hypothetical protein